VFGEGDLDLVLVPGFLTHIELAWEFEELRLLFTALGSFARVITFDRRGSGLSDPLPTAPTLEERMDDVRAVMDAAGSERAVLFGTSEGVPLSILFAAAHPERTRSLICAGGMARSTYADDYPWATPADALLESNMELVAPHWGEGAMIEVVAPSRADEPEVRAYMARLERSSTSPGMLQSMFEMFLQLDVRDVVPTVHVPALVLHRTHDRLVNVRHGRWLAEHLPNARMIELPGSDHNVWSEDAAGVLAEVREFVTGTRYAVEPERALRTLLFTDIVDSTRTAEELGDQRWRSVLEGHQSAVRDALRHFDGDEVNTTGDGFLATFDGPARAINCARTIVDASELLGVRIRAGVHTGEVEVMGDDVGGIGVHIAARVSALAAPGEVLVSRTVKDLVIGSPLRFEDRGVHELKGVSDTWQLHAVAD
jgi:class 3 adenylate cyclase